MKKFFKNTVYSLLGKAIGMVLLVLLDILLARELSVEQYAEWAYFFSIASMLFFIGWLGINMSAKVIVSRCVEESSIKACIKGGFLLRIISGIICSFILMIIMVFLSDKLGYPLKYPNLKNMFLLSGFLIFFNSTTEFFKEIFIGVINFKAVVGITVIEYLGYFAYSFLFLFFSGNVYSVIWGYAASGMTVFVIGTMLLIKDYHIICVQNKDIVFQYIKKIAKYSIPMLLVGIGVIILIEIDIVMLGMLSSKTEIAVYNIAKNINSKATHINYSLCAGTMASFAVISKNEIMSKKEDFRKIERVNILITMGIVFAIYLFTPAYITFFYGMNYSKAASVARVLIFYYVLYAVANFYSAFLDFRGKAQIRSISYVVIIILDIGLNYILIPRYGAYGAAIATSLSLIPYTFIVTIFTVREWNRIQKQI